MQPHQMCDALCIFVYPVLYINHSSDNHVGSRWMGGGSVKKCRGVTSTREITQISEFELNCLDVVWALPISSDF